MTIKAQISFTSPEKEQTPGIVRLNSTENLLLHINRNETIFLDATEEDMEGGFDIYTAPSQQLLIDHLRKNVYTKNKNTLIIVHTYEFKTSDCSYI